MKSLSDNIPLLTAFIILTPLLLIGFLFWVYSKLVVGFLFFILMPLMIIVSLGFYIFLLIILSLIVYRHYEPIKEGVYKVGSKGWFAWLRSVIIINILELIGNFNISNLAPFAKIICKTFGNKIGSANGDLRAVEFSLVDIGNNVFIGARAQIWGHILEGNKLHIKRVKLGNNCTIGAKSIVMPGAVIGDGTIVGAMSLVPKNAVLEPNSVYVGIPVRKLKSLKP